MSLQLVGKELLPNVYIKNIDVFDYDCRDVQRSVVMALLECKQYKIKLEKCLQTKKEQ